MTGEAIVNEILIDALWALGAIGMLLALVAGLVLVISPQLALQIGDKLNREFSVGWLKHALDAPRNSQPFIYRHHRIVGLFLLLATLYFFWVFATGYRTDALAAMFAGTLPPVVLELLATTATVVLVIGNALGLMLGVLMLTRPSALKRVEALANRWVDTDKAAEILDRRVDRPEGFASQYPRRLGLAILLATAYVGLIAMVVLK